MKTVRDGCKVQDNALSIKLSDQIEQLDQLIHVEGEGEAFFEKTHITQGMQDLISEGIARLAGMSSQAVFHLKQAMGGGKTHLLVGFGLLAKHPSLRNKYCPGLLAARAFKEARIAAFNGRNNPDHFFWGEIASQLGKGDQFKAFWTGGPKAPDEKDWLRLFEGGGPVLILLDEMPPYFHYLDTQKVGNGTVADIATRAFANLLTASGKKSNVCVVVSDLAATYDIGIRLINRALEDARQDTVYWIGSELAKMLPGEPVAVYAGVGKSGMFRGEEFASVEREEIKAAVKKRSIRLVAATDAACEGLNLQTLGTLINVDLPWNPSRLEQRLGRIKRFGQARRTVDMLNLVYHDTQDEKIYHVLSRRMKDKFDIFGGLPDTIEDEWIETVEKLEEMMDQFIHLRQKARDVFELRYKETIDPDQNRWELCSRVLSRRDVEEKLSEPW